MADAELTHFQNTVDLPELVASYGYQRDLRESTKRSVILRRADGGKLVVSQARRGGWIYYDARTGRHGNAIDFVREETGDSYGHIRQLLRTWTGSSKPSLSPTDPKSLSEASVRLIEAAELWNRARWIPRPRYLLERGLDAALSDPRFVDRWRASKGGTIYFPHHDERGLCGLELRRPGWKSFMKGTVKGLWKSRNLDQAKTIFITESSIDALAHCELYGWDCAYVALAGNPSQKQKALLQELFSTARERFQQIMIGVDNDEAGSKLASQLNDLAGYPLERRLPIGKDWAEDLEYCHHERSGK